MPDAPPDAIAMTDTEPLSVYRERLLQVRRRFELYDDRIVVTATWLFSRRFRTTIRLADLTPHKTEVRIRQRLLKRAIPFTGPLARPRPRRHRRRYRLAH